MSNINSINQSDFEVLALKAMLQEAKTKLEEHGNQIDEITDELVFYQSQYLLQQEEADKLKERIKVLESNPVARLAASSKVTGLDRLCLMTLQAVQNSYPSGMQISKIAACVNPELAHPIKAPYYKLKVILEFYIELGLITQVENGRLYFWNKDFICSFD